MSQDPGTGVQLMESVRRVAFTSPEDSLVILLCDGRLIEVHGDGFVQEQLSEGEIVQSQI